MSESLQTALSSLDGVLKSVHERDSLMHFASEEEVSYLSCYTIMFASELIIQFLTIVIHTYKLTLSGNG